MGNNWKQIWERRQIDETKPDRSDINKLFLELKRANGVDLMDGGIPLDSLLGK